jgi:hypothetical protein
VPNAALKYRLDSLVFNNMNLLEVSKVARHNKTLYQLDGIFLALLKGFLRKNAPFKDGKIGNR